MMYMYIHVIEYEVTVCRKTRVRLLCVQMANIVYNFVSGDDHFFLSLVPRFNYNSLFGGKVNKQVAYVEHLNMRPFMSEPQVINHWLLI